MLNRTAFRAGVLVCSAVFPLHSWAISTDEAARQLESINWYSEEYPPYNYQAGKEVEGISVDILMAAFEKLGVNVSRRDIKIVPWNRSYKFIQTKPGTALFSMTYTEERAEIMRFVGPAVPSTIAVIAPKSSGLTVDSEADLEKLKIGVVRDDIGDLLLRDTPVDGPNVSRRNSLKALLYLLRTGRIDAIAYNVGVFGHAIAKPGDDARDLYEQVFVLKEGHLGYAFHHSTDPEVLTRLQEAVDALRADGTIDTIISNYSD